MTPIELIAATAALAVVVAVVLTAIQGAADG